MELRIILQDSLEYISDENKEGFSSSIYKKRRKSFIELTKSGSRIDAVLKAHDEKGKKDKISAGEFIQTQIEKCSEDLFDDNAIYLKEENGTVKFVEDGLLEVMHVLIETNLNLGLITDALVADLYDKKEFPDDVSQYLSYNEAFYYSYAAQTVTKMISSYFTSGLEGKRIELESVGKKESKSFSKKKGLAQIATASVGMDSAIKMFHLLKLSYRMGDKDFIDILNEVESIIKPYDNQEIIKTNFEEDKNMIDLDEKFQDYTLKFKYPSNYMFKNIYLRYSN